MKLLLALFVPLVLAHGAAKLPSRSVSRDPNTVLVLFGTRHGNRQPENFLEENPRTWGFEGATELSSFGKKQGYGLGKEIRRFVGNLVNTNYNSSEVKYYSSSANRCQMTLQVVQAGIHVPKDFGVWDNRGQWSPVPYTIDDPMLRMYNVDDCPNNKKVWDPISKDTLPELKAMKKKHSRLLDHCKSMTKWDMSNLGKMADLADNLIEIDLYKAKYPKWIDKPTLRGYTGASLKKEILEFAEIHQIACAEYEPCRNLMTVYWLQAVLDSLKKAADGKLPKLIGYAAHTETTLALMKQMGYKKDELNTSAGFVIEFRNKPSPSVRLLNHDPNPIDDHVIYPAELEKTLGRKAGRDGWVPLKDFINYIQPHASSDWRKACGSKTRC